MAARDRGRRRTPLVASDAPSLECSATPVRKELGAFGISKAFASASLLQATEGAVYELYRQVEALP